MFRRVFCAAIIAGALARTNSSLVSSPGQSAVIPSWTFQSTSDVGNNVSGLSQPGFDTSSWYTVSSRGTLVAGLIESGVYDEGTLFYSDTLATMIETSPFTVPWFYRNKFSLQLSEGQHYFLKTNGITSRADIYLNGKQIAGKDFQAGAYGGHVYDVTKSVISGQNVLLIRVYPTDYLKDFALGFVDWNPYPPDNGTGIWRNVELQQTGAVSISPPRVLTSFETPGPSSVEVTVKAEVFNHGNRTVRGTVRASISDGKGTIAAPSQGYELGPGQSKTATLITTLNNPKIWWPKQWGDQALYSTQVEASMNETVSDVSENRQFGIRHVESHVNEHNDTIFSVNGQPFQVRGGGYTPDMFLRFNKDKVRSQLQYVLDMGLNTIRLEGKQEHPELYELADELGVMILAGWECCDKWEAWTYNEDTDAVKWNDGDYGIANASMRHEASMMQTHPSMLGFLVGSDYWPDDRATGIYVKALHDLDWNAAIIASAAKKSYPKLLGPGGMKMDGPYDWVPPVYWSGDQLGAAFGFGSEQGAGVGTPEMGSLRKFLSESDLEDLWKQPNKGLFHMSTNVSSFYDRSIHNDALFHRYGNPTSLDDYLLKAQMMDYEATRAEYEGFSAKWNAPRPATGVIYWMLNNAWPSLHWNLFDYYLKPAGSYYGTKVGNRLEHVSYDYGEKSVYLINHSVDSTSLRQVEVELLSSNGTSVYRTVIQTTTKPNTSTRVGEIPNMISGVTFLRLRLLDSRNTVLSRNVYWLSSKPDVLNWDNSTWYYTPATSYADFTTLQTLQNASVTANSTSMASSSSNTRLSISLQNTAKLPAVFLRLNLVDDNGLDVLPVFWSDNYLTLWPGERIEVELQYPSSYSGVQVQLTGRNVGPKILAI